jgi:hypothetical protein
MSVEGRSAASGTSRRTFLGTALSVGATAALVQAQAFLRGRSWLEVAQAATIGLPRDTFNGLFAFVVPGSDVYSIAQGVSTADLGGVDAGAADVLIATVDASTPFVPSFSTQVAAILNGLAQSVNPTSGGAFISPFARLSFAEKTVVFEIMDATDALKLLGGLLPPFVAFFSYSEAGVYDPATRSLTGIPLGWQLCDYQGVADGRDEFLGYFTRGRNQE